MYINVRLVDIVAIMLIFNYVDAYMSTIVENVKNKDLKATLLSSGFLVVIIFIVCWLTTLV